MWTVVTDSASPLAGRELNLIARSVRPRGCLRSWICLGLMLVWISTAAGQQSIPDSLERDYSAELPRIPPRSPAEALASFEVLPGFELSLIACEPLVVDPVAFAFDARERLFVVEMRGYSEEDHEYLGRIALLQDTDADGRMDHRTTFVDGLAWPTAVWPWKDGVLVTHPPHLTWFRDTDQDGISDLREEWFRGFGKDNVQGMVNSFRWGIDGYLHGATSSTGAKLTAADGSSLSNRASDSGVLALRRRDVVIDPVTRSIRPASGGGQHGLSFNRWGDKFVTSNSDHLQQVIDLDGWLTEHPSEVLWPALRRSIAVDGPQAEVFRASPVEPWRIVRTRLRASGVVPGIVEGGGRPAGYFTGATGTWIMDGEVGFGDPDSDTALVCDVGSNLVHRKRLIDQGLYWSGERIDADTELLRSRDIWFRPVQLGDAPDGSLVIADMYREVIEHPKSLPPIIKKHLDLTSGRDRGRIWRLRPTDRFPAAAEIPSERRKLGDLSPRELVRELQSPVTWRRRMASQLLIELGEPGVAPALVNLALSDARPEFRLLAMHVANRLGTLTSHELEELLLSSHPRMIAAALDLVRQHHCGSDMVGTLVQLSENHDARVQLQLAAVCADLSPADSHEILRKLIPAVEEPLVRSVCAAAAGDTAWRLFQEEQIAAMSPKVLAAWLDLMLPLWAKASTEQADLRAWLASRLVDFQQPRHAVWLDSLVSSSNRQELNLILSCLKPLELAQLRNWIVATLQDRVDSRTTTWITLLDEPRRKYWIQELLEPLQSPEVQQAAIDVVGLFASAELEQVLLDAFPSFTPSLQDQALRTLVKRPSAVSRVLDAVQTGQIRPSQFPVDVRQQILALNDESLVSRAAQLLGQASADRAGIIEAYSEFHADWLATMDTKSKLEAASKQGAEQFERVCGQCHRVADRGNDVGAALTQLADKSARQLIEAVLDPNREVDPRYASYTILLVDGRVITGVIQEESPNQIIVATAGGQLIRLNRSEIARLKSTGLSLMPEGLEEQLTPRQLAEILVFLQAPQ